jgi:CHASE2 domain-containing sensor protein
VNASTWHSYRLVAALVAAGAIIGSFTPAAYRLEHALLGGLAGFMPRAPQPESVVVVAIDGRTLARLGGWPWPRDRLATTVERLAALQPKVIGLTLPLSAAQTPPRLTALQAELEALEPSLQARARAWLAELDTDAQLADAIESAGNVVLSARVGARDAAASNQTQLLRFTMPRPGEALPWHRRLARLFNSPRPVGGPEPQPPLARFAEAAAAVGSSARYRDGQRVHAVATVSRLGELALLAAMQPGDTGRPSRANDAPVRVGKLGPIGSASLEYYPRPAAAVPIYSLVEVLQDDKLAHEFRGKAVLLGLTAPALAPRLRGPGGQPHTPVSWSAQVLGDMLQTGGLTVPRWAWGVQRALLVLLSGGLLLLPATWHRLRAPLVSAVLSVGLLNTEAVLLVAQRLWLPVAVPAGALAGLQILLTLAWHRHRVHSEFQQQATEARLELGQNLQSQGQFDLAMDQFVRCLPVPAALESLYELGLDYERRRQVARAQAAYARLEDCVGQYRDAASRRRRLAALAERFPNTHGAEATQTLGLDNPVLALPVLGRYRLHRELGSGAMGTVYLAEDPTIGRQIAVKTLPLLEETNVPDSVGAVARFFREAETVGRLAHPNIVAVHDAGREHDLAYMAMDYVPGESLDAFTQQPSLLPVWEVLEVAAQVADALGYAHGRKVVHRDIKPSNIIYDRASGIAKITDFGVARMLDSSRTRTGTILGSPCYMSPEQVAGRRIDGRSDLFSLGISLYQLLSGTLPFTGESAAQVMYRITNARTPPMRKARRDLPVSVTRLVTRALHKEPSRRFAGGAEMAEAIRKCRTQLRGGRRRTA